MAASLIRRRWLPGVSSCRPSDGACRAGRRTAGCRTRGVAGPGSASACHGWLQRCAGGDDVRVVVIVDGVGPEQALDDRPRPSAGAASPRSAGRRAEQRRLAADRASFAASAGRPASPERAGARGIQSERRDQRGPTGKCPRMRILYGVVGEGMGHAMRSGVILDHLTKNHEVQVVVSGRAHDYLVKRASERLSVRKIWGLSIVYEDNEVQNFRTVAGEPEGRGHGHAQERARLLRHRREVRARRRDLRLRELELPVRQEPPPAGAVGRQHPDAHPLHARARDPGRARDTSSASRRR